MAKKIIDNEDLIKENLKLKKEYEWDRHKIAYLESILVLKGINPKKCKSQRKNGSFH